MASRVKSGTIQVEGLADLSRALKSMDTDLARELRLTNKSVASKVAEHARSAAMSIGGVAAKAAPSIKASAGVRSAGVSFGGSGYPFAAGAEFGSMKYTQFQPWRGNDSGAGYFVYPTIRQDADAIQDEYVDAVNKLLARAFPD